MAREEKRGFNPLLCVVSLTGTVPQESVFFELRKPTLISSLPFLSRLKVNYTIKTQSNKDGRLKLDYKIRGEYKNTYKAIKQDYEIIQKSLLQGK